MAPSPVLALTEHFAHLDDPRVERTRLPQLLDIVVIAICAVITGAESWDDIALFGEAKRAWFAKSVLKFVSFFVTRNSGQSSP